MKVLHLSELISIYNLHQTSPSTPLQAINVITFLQHVYYVTIPSTHPPNIYCSNSFSTLPSTFTPLTNALWLSSLNVQCSWFITFGHAYTRKCAPVIDSTYLPNTLLVRFSFNIIHGCWDEILQVLALPYHIHSEIGHLAILQTEAFLHRTCYTR